MMVWLQRRYQPLLRKAIRVKYIVITATVGLFAISLWVFRGMGGEFIPQLQEGDFAFHCILPQGSSLDQSIETSMQASRILKSFDEVKMVVGKTGAAERSEEHTSELQSLMRISYAVFCLKKKNKNNKYSQNQL